MIDALNRQPRLTDAQEMHRLHPYTFGVPDRADLDQIAPGWSVKVCFEAPVGTNPQSERMWVRVTEVYGPWISGILDNDPVVVEMECGDPVTLETRHVYQIQDLGEKV